MNWLLPNTNMLSVKKMYRKVRRKYIEQKRFWKQMIRYLFSPYLAIKYIIEQIEWGHFPSLDKNMFMTDSILERWLYYDIRKIYEGKIIPQYPIGPYWADFALPDYRLVIELDGQKYHQYRKDHDRRRDAYMTRKGWEVLRFSYNDVKKNRHKTIEKIIHVTLKIDQKRKKPLAKSYRNHHYRKI